MNKDDRVQLKQNHRMCGRKGLIGTIVGKIPVPGSKKNVIAIQFDPNDPLLASPAPIARGKAGLYITSVNVAQNLFDVVGTN